VVDDGAVAAAGLGAPLTDVRLRASVEEGVLAVDSLTATWVPGRIDASGRVPLSFVGALPLAAGTTGPATFRVDLEAFDPGVLPGVPSGLHGEVRARLEGVAPAADASALEATAVFETLRLSLGTLDIAQEQPVGVRIVDGRATLDPVRLSGTAGTLDVGGSVGLVGDRPLDLETSGALEVAALAALVETGRGDGTLTLDLRARGTAASPALSGFLEIEDGTFTSDTPELAARRVQVRLDVADRRIEVTRLSAELNGGTLESSGWLALGEGTIQELDLQLATRGFAYDAPLDLRSLSDADLRIVDRAGDLVVEGTVTIEEGGLTGDINFDTAVLDAALRPRRLDLTTPRNPLLERVRFDVAAVTEQPILLDNNLATGEVDFDVRVLGSPYETGLTGRLDLRPGAVVALNERRYEVDRGIIRFTGETEIVPQFDLQLQTSVSRFDVTLAITGTPGDTDTSLTSLPVLPEPDIMALLVTGRTLDEMRGEEFDIAREQMLSYLAGSVTSRLSRGLEESTGFDEVRIDTELIASEGEPGARLTIAEDFSDRFRLVFSRDLSGSNGEIWLAEYDLTHRFGTRAVRQEDDYRFDFRHVLGLGGQPAPERQPRSRPEITALAVEGADEARLREVFGVEVGDSYDFFAIRDGIERLEEHFRAQQRLQARIRLDREITDDAAALMLTVEAGPRVEIQITGVSPPRTVFDDVALAWSRGVFDAQRADDARDRLWQWLADRRYLDATIQSTVTDERADLRRVVLAVSPGVRFETVTLAFEGAGPVVGCAPQVGGRRHSRPHPVVPAQRRLRRGSAAAARRARWTLLREHRTGVLSVGNDCCNFADGRR
jgi:hypothetical protein